MHTSFQRMIAKQTCFDDKGSCARDGAVTHPRGNRSLHRTRNTRERGVKMDISRSRCFGSKRTSIVDMNP